MKNQLLYLYLGLRDFVEILRGNFQSIESLEYLFYRYGWNVPLDEPVFNSISNQLSFKNSLELFLSQAEALHEELETEPGDISITRLSNLAASGHALLKDIAGFSIQDLTGLGEPLSRVDFWTEIGDHLLDDITEQYFRFYHPIAYLVLHAWGAIRYEPMQPQGMFRLHYTRTVFDWPQAFAMIKDPGGTFKNRFGWTGTGENFQYQLLLETLRNVMTALQVPAYFVTPDPDAVLQADSPFLVDKKVDALKLPLLYKLSWLDAASFEASLLLIPLTRENNSNPAGLLLRPVLRGGMGRDLTLNRDFKLKWDAQVEAGSILTVAVFPDSANMTGGKAALNSGISLFSVNTQPFYLLGKANTTRIELSGLTLTATLAGSVGDPELKLTLRTGFISTGAGCKVVIELSDSDGFVKDTLKRPSIEFFLSPEIIMSSKSGITINGNPKLEFEFPLNQKIGGITTKNARLATLEHAENGLVFQLGVGVQGNLGPITFLVENLGFDLCLNTYKREELASRPDKGRDVLLGNLGLDLAYSPPRGLGFAIDALSVQGGGYLEFNPEKGEYLGAAELTVMDKITLKAVGLVQADLPGGGYSFLLLIQSEFEPIPLGFGFKLEGVGGLVGLHRRLDQDAVLATVKSQAADQLLFPADPLGNVHNLIAGWNGIMPVSTGSHSFGLMGKLSWGSDQLIDIKAGLLLETPRMNLAIIGTARSEITRTDEAGEKNTLLRLQIAFAARYQPDRALFGFDASLYDSEVLGQQLSGAAALRLRGGDDPYFMLAVGGKHPDFSPPPGLGLPALERVAIKLNPKIPGLELDASFYCALTSNTVQFGASATASYHVWGIGISGGVELDALFQVRPLYFKVQAHGWVKVDLWGFSGGLHVKGMIEGPYPFRFSLYVSVPLLFWEKDFHLPTFTIGKSARPELPVIDVLPLLRSALEDRRNWRTLMPEGANLLVSLRKETDDIPGAVEPAAEKPLRCHPLGGLIVDQGVVPLGISIDKFGAFQPRGYNRFSISLLGDQEEAPTTEKQEQFFAPDQFFELSDDDKINRPSYEKMPSGIRIGGSELTSADKVLERSVRYKTSVYDGERQTKPERKDPHNPVDGPFLHLARRNSVAGSSLGRKSEQRQAKLQAFRVQRETYAVVDRHTLGNFEGFQAGSAAEAERLLAQLVEERPELERRLQVAPMHELD